MSGTLCSVMQLNLRTLQAEALHYDKRSLDKLLQHRQAELDGMHARLQAALVRDTSCMTRLSSCTTFELPYWQHHSCSAAQPVCHGKRGHACS